MFPIMTITNVVIYKGLKVIEILNERETVFIFEYYVEYDDSADLYYKVGLVTEDRLSASGIKNLIEVGYFDKEG